MISDFHIHSKYSYDSNMEPEKILKYCFKLGIDTISITDHETIQGSINAQKYSHTYGIKVIMGEEIKTDHGDIIGLQLNEEIKNRNAFEVIDEIREQGGIVVFPHPFRSHKNIESIAKEVDLIEVWNSRSNSHSNIEAFKLSGKYNISPLAGSDAHTYSEIGNAFTICDGIYDIKKTLICKEASRYSIFKSWVIKDAKLQEYQRMPKHCLKFVLGK